ncbi:MAG: hypothetical protein DRJ52_00640 [Thermoprotei archaeon]|nr:MAG: hypothetical protein DRJ52_00640 [Thermoprotei archaeon]RLF00475.1 MAG: hypothetical protein DRJ63_02190 [Thermoprotei archaeon]HDI75279.1 hypothetical protein [Thermoprotei archaeon]
MQICSTAYQLFGSRIHIAYCTAEVTVSKGQYEELLSIAKKAAEKKACSVVFIKPKVVFSDKILALAFYYAEKSFEQGFNISRDLNLETLLYLSATRQISRVLEKTAWNPADKKAFICCCSLEDSPSELLLETLELLNSTYCSCRLKPDLSYIRDLYGITEEEIAATSSNSLLDKMFKLVSSRLALFFAENSRKASLPPKLN